jgi:hypothetical protein
MVNLFLVLSNESPRFGTENPGLGNEYQAFSSLHHKRVLCT